MRWREISSGRHWQCLICTEWMFLAFSVRTDGDGEWTASVDNDDGWEQEAFCDDCESGKAWCQEKLKQCWREFTHAVLMEGVNANSTENIRSS